MQTTYYHLNQNLFSLNVFDFSIMHFIGIIGYNK